MCTFYVTGTVLSAWDVLQALSLHILDGVVKSTDLSDGLVAEPLAGGPLTIRLGDEVKIEAENSVATVISADIEACKSVIHVIDTVLY